MKNDHHHHHQWLRIGNEVIISGMTERVTMHHRRGKPKNRPTINCQIWKKRNGQVSNNTNVLLRKKFRIFQKRKVWQAHNNTCTHSTAQHIIKYCVLHYCIYATTTYPFQRQLTLLLRPYPSLVPSILYSWLLAWLLCCCCWNDCIDENWERVVGGRYDRLFVVVGWWFFVVFLNGLSFLVLTRFCFETWPDSSDDWPSFVARWEFTADLLMADESKLQK